MILEFNLPLTEQLVFAHGDELAAVMARDVDAQGKRVYSHDDGMREHVATIPDPVLVTDYWRISGLPPRTRDTVYKLYESPRRSTVYGGTRIDFQQDRYPGTWGPNIDTLLLCRALTAERLAGVRSAIEIGCGSGFISRFLLEHAPQLTSMTLVDINPNAIRCARDNIQDPRATFIHGDGLLALQGQEVDLIVCNPPYIPRPGSIGDNAYEGVGLLAYFIEQGPRHLSAGGRIITNISSVCESITTPLLRTAGIDAVELDRLRVPLKVLNVLNNPAWMRFLLEEKGLVADTHDGYEYWHTVMIKAWGRSG